MWPEAHSLAGDPLCLMFKAAVSEWKVACTKEPAKNNERGEERNKKKASHRSRAAPGGHCVSSGLASSLPSSTQSSNHPHLPPPKEKLKAFFWEQRGLPRLLLFTFGRTAIGGKFKHRKRPLVTGRAADGLGGWPWFCWVLSLQGGAQVWDLTADPCLDWHEALSLQLFLRLFPSRKDIAKNITLVRTGEVGLGWE